MAVVEFEDIAGPLDSFIEEYRHKKPLLRLGVIANPKELISLREIDDLLTSEAIRPPYFRVAKDGAPVRQDIYTQLTRVQLAHIDDVVDPAKVIQAFQAGATVTWNSMNHFNSRLREITTTISRTLGCRSDVVSFLTPGGKVQGFAPHLDSTEVFVVQLQGQKKWSVWDTLSPRPPAGSALDPRTLGEPTMEFVMNPGDVLYLPWGTPHVASSVDQMSFHLSITTKPRSLAELLQDIVKVATDTDEAFSYQPTLNASQSDALVGALDKAVRHLVLKLDGLDVEAASGKAIDDASRQIGTGHIDYFESLSESESELSEETLVKRPGDQEALTYVASDPGKVDVVVGIRKYRMDEGVVPALEVLRKDDKIQIAEISSIVGAAAAITLVKTLMRVGYLKSVGN